MNKSKLYQTKHKNNNHHPQLTGTIFKKVSGGFTVHSGENAWLCTLSPNLLKVGSDIVTVGDQVSFMETYPGSGQITDLLPRRNKLARRSPVPMPSAVPHEQVIVANLDQVAPVFAAANPEPKWNMLDRYLVSAESAGISVQIIITKLDLAQDDERLNQELMNAAEEYRKIGYPVILVSSHTGQGIEDARQALGGRVTAFLGKSGVGKTSLLNAIQPGLGLRVNQVNQVTGKGKHTTTHLEMFPLAEGGAVVDTPGVREFGLWDVYEDDLAYFFPEMRPFLGTCRFKLDCTHNEEPGCAIRKAVMSGSISPRRYQSYMRLKEEVAFV